MILWFFIIIAIGFLGFAVYLYFGQSRLIFFPTKEHAVTPADLDIDYDDVRVESEPGLTVHGWYIEPKRPPDSAMPVVLFCHGNAGNISHRLQTAAYLMELGSAVLLFDYRGYGLSEGSPGEPGIYRDADAFYDWLVETKGYAPQQIVVFGRSLGGTVAVDLAAHRPCRGLIVESSLTSAEDMAQKMFPFFPVRWLLKYKLNSLEKISAVSSPVLVTHSPEDDLIPYEMGRKLYEAASEPKRFVELVGGHNDRSYFELESYRTAVNDILNGTARRW